MCLYFRGEPELVPHQSVLMVEVENVVHEKFKQTEEVKVFNFVVTNYQKNSSNLPP